MTPHKNYTIMRLKNPLHPQHEVGFNMYSHEQLDVLLATPLFEGISYDNTLSMLSCLGARKRACPRDTVVLAAGSLMEHVGVVLSGTLHLLQEDENGDRILLAPLGPGSFFGEALCCAGVRESPVTVIAETAANVMLLDFKKILNVCPRTCQHHTQLIENMMCIIAKKNLFLQSRLEILSKKSIRERVLLFLHSQCRQRGRPFTVSLDRNGMADYLGTDRSALSRELGRMKADGLLDFDKNVFLLK